MKHLIPNSIFSLILWRIVLAMLVFTAIIALIAYTQIDRTLIDLRDRSLEQEAADIAAYMEKTEDGLLFLDMPAQSREFYARSGKIRQYVIRDEHGKIVFTSPISFPDLYPDTLDEEDNAVFEFTGPQGTAFLGTGIRHEYDGQIYLIQVAQSQEVAESFSDELTTNFLDRILWVGLPFLVLLLGVIFLSLKQSFKPLLLASRQARSISFENLDKRIEENLLPLELQPLVKAVNHALDRLGKGIKVQQEFTANVAHELRTPLTIFKSRLEMLGDNAVARELEKDVEEMIHTVNQMLDLSKLDFPEAIGMDDIDLVAVVKAVCQDMWPLFIQQGRELNLSGMDQKIRVHGNRDLLYRAIRNLLDNALVHAPAKTPVEVSVSGNSVFIRDHGYRISREDEEKIFQRFHRNDRQKFRPGSGLGLSIVSKTMDMHGGRILIETPEKGQGNIFRMKFPVLG